VAGLRAAAGGGSGWFVWRERGALRAPPGVPPALAARLAPGPCDELAEAVAGWRALAVGTVRPSALQADVARELRALCAAAALPAPEGEAPVAGFAVDVLLRAPWAGETWAGRDILQRAGGVAVEVDGPSHGDPGGEGGGGPAPARALREHGGIATATGFKEWVVGAAGFEVVRVPWREWEACGGDAGEQRRYLRGRLLGTSLGPFLERVKEEELS